MANIDMSISEQEFIRIQRELFNDVYLPMLEQHIKLEVNRQVSKLTATLVAGLIQK